MATKKSDSGSTAPKAKPVSVKALTKQVALTEETSEELIIENFAAMSQVMLSMSEALEVLVRKVESMACHIIATEEVLGEIVADNGLNIVRVNARIRAKFEVESEITTDLGRTIDVAASIASPLPRR